MIFAPVCSTWFLKKALKIHGFSILLIFCLTKVSPTQPAQPIQPNSQSADFHVIYTVLLPIPSWPVLQNGNFSIFSQKIRETLFTFLRTKKPAFQFDKLLFSKNSSKLLGISIETPFDLTIFFAIFETLFTFLFKNNSWNHTGANNKVLSRNYQ